MLQNVKVTAFTVSELLRETQQWVEGEITLLPPTLELMEKKFLSLRPVIEK